MIITGKRSSATDRALLSIDGEQMEEVQSMKYLGVQIDNKLSIGLQKAYELEKNRQKHETNLEKTKAVRFLEIRLKKIVTMKYIINYALQLCSWLQMKTFRKLQLLQNRTLRIILKNQETKKKKNAD
jgi:hypothetical protein